MIDLPKRTVTIVGLGKTGTEMVSAAVECSASLNISEIHLLNRDSNGNSARMAKSDAVFEELTDFAHTRSVRIIIHSDYAELPTDGLHVISAKESSYNYTEINPRYIREMTVRRDAPLIYMIARGYRGLKNFSGLVFVVSNPSGPFAGIFSEHSGIPLDRVHQFGTQLDTLRWRKHLNIAAKVRAHSELRQQYEQGMTWIDIARHAQRFADHHIDALVIGDHSSMGNVFLESCAKIDGKSVESLGKDILDRVRKETIEQGPRVAASIGYTAKGVGRAFALALEFQFSKDPAFPLPWGNVLRQASVTMPVRKHDGKFDIADDLMTADDRRLLEKAADSVRLRYEREREYATDKQIRRILVLDDEIEVAEGVAWFLKRCMAEDREFSDANKCSVDLATSVDGANSILNENLYDFVVIDEKLGGRSLGHEVLAEFSARQPGLRAAVLSARTELTQSKAMIGQAEIVAFIDKPIEDNLNLEYTSQKNWILLKERFFTPTQQVIR